MSLVDEDAFRERPIVRIFLAATVGEARRVEAVLDQRDVDYFVRVEAFGRTLFGSERHGATFFVEAGRADDCEAALVEAGLGFGVLRDLPGGDRSEGPST